MALYSLLRHVGGVKFLSIALAVLTPLSVLPAAPACRGAEAAADARNLHSTTEAFDIDQLHLQAPFWSSETVYREGLFFIQDAPDRPPAATLLLDRKSVV